MPFYIPPAVHSGSRSGLLFKSGIKKLTQATAPLSPNSSLAPHLPAGAGPGKPGGEWLSRCDVWNVDYWGDTRLTACVLDPLARPQMRGGLPGAKQANFRLLGRKSCRAGPPCEVAVPSPRTRCRGLRCCLRVWVDRRDLSTPLSVGPGPSFIISSSSV